MKKRSAERVKGLQHGQVHAARPTGPHSAEQAQAQPFILGRDAFAKISEVEGIRLDSEARAAFAEFDARGLSHEERRHAIIGRFKRGTR